MAQIDIVLKLFAVAALLSAAPLQAQELRLFEAVETASGANSPAAIQAREQRNMSSNAPAFTLLGTSRIAGKTKATLVTSDGEVLRVQMQGDGSTPIPEHAGYRLVEVSSRSVAISLPADTPCVAAEDKGVRCGADGLARLSLTTAAPLKVSSADTAQTAQDSAAKAAEQAPENPFAAALRAAAQNEAAAQSRRGRAANERFEVRRIAPEDVPPGMRLVRTPFGDRLVEL